MTQDAALPRHGILHRNLVRARTLLQKSSAASDIILSRYLHRPPHCLPILLMFVTERCPLRCKMCGVCYQDPSSQNVAELTTDEWKGVIRSAASLSCSLLSISGGEPLLRPDLYSLIRFATDLGISVHLCSNAILLNEERAEALRDSGLKSISISVDSPTPELHELLRGPDTFERTVNGIRLLRRIAPSIRIGINCLVSAVNFQIMADMVPFAESLGVQQLKFAPIHTHLLHRRKSIEQYEGLLLEQKDMPALVAEIERFQCAAAKSRLLRTSDVFLARMARLTETYKRFRCYAGYVVCAVSPTGKVAPCVDMDGVFSVRDMPLEAIWRSPEFNVLRTRVHQCERKCWETTYTDISLRLSVGSLLRNAVATFRDVDFYHGDEPM